MLFCSLLLEVSDTRATLGMGPPKYSASLRPLRYFRGNSMPSFGDYVWRLAKTGLRYLVEFLLVATARNMALLLMINILYDLLSKLQYIVGGTGFPSSTVSPRDYPPPKKSWVESPLLDTARKKRLHARPDAGIGLFPSLG